MFLVLFLAHSGVTTMKASCVACAESVSLSERERGRTHDGEVDGEVVVPEGRERVVGCGDHLVERCNGYYFFLLKGR